MYNPPHAGDEGLTVERLNELKEAALFTQENGLFIQRAEVLKLIAVASSWLEHEQEMEKVFAPVGNLLCDLAEAGIELPDDEAPTPSQPKEKER